MERQDLTNSALTGPRSPGSSTGASPSTPQGSVTETDVRRESERYYESLKAPLKQLETWWALRRAPGLKWRALSFLSIVAALTMAMSLFPFLPYISFRPIWGSFPTLDLQSLLRFGILWIAWGAISTIVAQFLIGYNTRNSPAEQTAPVLLTGRQQIYVHVVNARKALDDYIVTKLTTHLDVARTELKKTFRGGTTFQPAEDEVVLTRPTRVTSRKREYAYTAYVGGSGPSIVAPTWAALEWEFRTIVGVASRNPWMGIEPSATDVLHRLANLSPSITSHVDAGERIDSVVAVLREFELFLFSILPEGSMRQGKADHGEIDTFARERASMLAELVDELGVLEPPPSASIPNERRSATLVRRIQRSVSFMPVRFVYWLLGLFSLLTLLALVIKSLFDISLESIVGWVIPTSVLGAATLAVVAHPPSDPGAPG